MDEYISREAVVRYLKGYSEKECNSNSPYGMITSSVLNKAERALSEMPVADVQLAKHGRWVEQKHTPTNGYNYNVPYSTYVCSSCRLEIHNDEYSKYVRGTYTNCPVCTARMDVSE